MGPVCAALPPQQTYLAHFRSGQFLVDTASPITLEPAANRLGPGQESDLVSVYGQPLHLYDQSMVLVDILGQPFTAVVQAADVNNTVLGLDFFDGPGADLLLDVKNRAFIHCSALRLTPQASTSSRGDLLLPRLIVSASVADLPAPESRLPSRHPIQRAPSVPRRDLSRLYPLHHVALKCLSPNVLVLRNRNFKHTCLSSTESTARRRPSLLRCTLTQATARLFSHLLAFSCMRRSSSLVTFSGSGSRRALPPQSMGRLNGPRLFTWRSNPMANFVSVVTFAARCRHADRSLYVADDP